MRRAASLVLLLISAAPLLAETPPESASRARPLSSKITTALTSALPSYRGADDSSAETDVALPPPRNGIVRLPRVVVEGSRVPLFREREIYTDKGLAELAVKRYFNDFGLALNRFRIPFFGMTKEAYAMMLWYEDERLKMMKEYGGHADFLETIGDHAGAKDLRTLINNTWGRTDYLPTTYKKAP